MNYIEQQLRRGRSYETLDKLMLELGVSIDNHHVGSGMGGDPSLWWFLINHTVISTFTEDPTVSWSAVGGFNEIIFYVPETFSLKQIRQSLKSFYETHPHRLDVTDEQLINLSFLRDQPLRHINAKVYVHLVEAALDLQKWLDLKIELNHEINKVFSKETDVFKAAFLQEMRLPASYFEDHNSEMDDPIKKMYYKHPVWGAKDAAASKRQQTMFNQLLSQEDLNNILLLGSGPQCITMGLFRRLVGTERMVALNLDERSECSFLSTINKSIKKIIDGQTDS